MKSVMQHNFSNIPQVEIPRSMFDRSHGYKTTFDSGYLVPFYIDEALPGDTFHGSATLFARLATPLKPFMDNLFMETFYFAVPYRLVWDNWQKFNGEQKNPNDSVDYLVPTMSSPAVTGYAVGSLSDYFGIPTEVPNLEHNSLWHRAYNLIWNEWFRDENLQNSIQLDTDDGPDNPTDYVLKKRGKRHDYFTSCLPWPQKGPGVELPLGGIAPVRGNGKGIGFVDAQTGFDPNYFGMVAAGGQIGEYLLWPSTAAFNTNVGTSAARNTAAPPIANQTIGVTPDGTKSGLVADLSAATAATINDLRTAFQIQKLLERDARGGTRYTEIIRSHFGVISPDARLQRPEYIGGSSCRININPVQQTSSTNEETPQGNLAAYGVGIDSNGGFSKSFTEHTLIIGLVNVRADLTYQQGLNRMFSRQTRYDFYWPSFAHLGEQAVLRKEIFANGVPAEDDLVFGYQERYAEYRYYPSQITGKFRSSYATPLDYWHLSQEFEEAPTLNSTFIEENVPLDRVIAVQTEPQFLFDSYMYLKCARPMPVYSVPGLIDHF